MAKSKNTRVVKQITGQQTSSRQQLDQARRAHAQGMIGTEDYIWAAMQCYTAEAKLAR